MAITRPYLTNLINPTEALPDDPTDTSDRIRSKYGPGADLSGFQAMIGRTVPQPLKGGTQTNAPMEQFPIVTPSPLPATQRPAPQLPSYSVPGGRHQYDMSGFSTYTNPTTGLRSWGLGQSGYRPAPAGSGVAYVRDPMSLAGFQDLFQRGAPRGRFRF